MENTNIKTTKNTDTLKNFDLEKIYAAQLAIELPMDELRRARSLLWWFFYINENREDAKHNVTECFDEFMDYAAEIYAKIDTVYEMLEEITEKYYQDKAAWDECKRVAAKEGKGIAL